MCTKDQIINAVKFVPFPTELNDDQLDKYQETNSLVGFIDSVITKYGVVIESDCDESAVLSMYQTAIS